MCICVCLLYNSYAGRLGSSPAEPPERRCIYIYIYRERERDIEREIYTYYLAPWLSVVFAAFLRDCLTTKYLSFIQGAVLIQSLIRREQAEGWPGAAQAKESLQNVADLCFNVEITIILLIITIIIWSWRLAWRGPGQRGERQGPRRPRRPRRPGGPLLPGWTHEYIWRAISIYLSIYLSMCIYIYIERERYIGICIIENPETDLQILIACTLEKTVKREDGKTAARVVYIYIYIYIHIYVCVYIYIYIHACVIL